MRNPLITCCNVVILAVIRQIDAGVGWVELLSEKQAWIHAHDFRSPIELRVCLLWLFLLWMVPSSLVGIETSQGLSTAKNKAIERHLVVKKSNIVIATAAAAATTATAATNNNVKCLVKIWTRVFYEKQLLQLCGGSAKIRLIGLWFHRLNAVYTYKMLLKSC